MLQIWSRYAWPNNCQMYYKIQSKHARIEIRFENWKWKPFGQNSYISVWKRLKSVESRKCDPNKLLGRLRTEIWQHNCCNRPSARPNGSSSLFVFSCAAYIKWMWKPCYCAAAAVLKLVESTQKLLDNLCALRKILEFNSRRVQNFEWKVGVFERVRLLPLVEAGSFS